MTRLARLLVTRLSRLICLGLLSFSIAATMGQAQQKAALPGDWEVTGLGEGSQFPIFGRPRLGLDIAGFVKDGDRVLNMGCDNQGNGFTWCFVQKLAGDKAAGYLLSQHVREITPPTPPTPKPKEFLYVSGLRAGDRLNVRRDPFLSAPVLATLAEGEKVRNFGCEQVNSTLWCRVQSTEGLDVTGWANGRFLSETAPRPPAPPAPEPPPPGSAATWEVFGLQGSAVLNMYQGPSLSSRVILSLINGDRVQFLGCQTLGGIDWCRVRYADGVDLTGWVDKRFLRDTTPPHRPPAPNPPSAEPDFWRVTGLQGNDTLNIRSEPSTAGRILARAPNGARLENLGCQTSRGQKWCRVRSTRGVDVTGYASARYLEPF